MTDNHLGCENNKCDKGGVSSSGEVTLPEERFALDDCEGLSGEALAVCYMDVAIHQKDLSICDMISDSYPVIKQECEWARG